MQPIEEDSDISTKEVGVEDEAEQGDSIMTVSQGAREMRNTWMQKDRTRDLLVGVDVIDQEDHVKTSVMVICLKGISQQREENPRM